MNTSHTDFCNLLFGRLFPHFFYLIRPTNWFHFIISLTLNFQCNTRSGISQEYMQPMKDCGFFVPPA